MTSRRPASLPLAIAGCLALVAGCSTGSSTPSSQVSGATATTPPAASDQSTPPGGSVSNASATTVKVTIANGTVSPNAATIDVAKGALVTVTVTSDVDTEVHVHGYDIEIQAAAGATVAKAFTADQVGTFEIETHEPARLVANLVVK